MSALRDAVLVAGTTVACSLGVAGAGVVALRRVRHRSLTAAATVVVAVALGAVVASVLATAALMFLSRHDLLVLVAVVAVSAPLSLAVALLLARSTARDSRSLADAVGSFGQVPYSASPARLGAELAALDRQLAAADARLQESLGRERALEAGRRDTVAWISHDLRTPIAGIRAMSEALVDGVVPDLSTVERYHQDIHRETERLSAMVDDLFELARINAGALRLSLQPVDVADVVSASVASALPVAAARHVRLVADPPEPGDVLASAPELGRVLSNVLSNAVRHTPPDGTVRVRTSRTADRIVVEVADACGGIAEQDLPRLFEVGYRGTAARTPGDGGAGLGLAIARGLVEAQRGDICVANDGPGCRVTVGLMAVAGTPPVTRQPAVST